MKSVAVIPSAGAGRRMGFVKKPFIRLAGRPILAMTIAPFEYSSCIDEIIPVVASGDEERCLKEIIGDYGFKKIKKVQTGGRERQDSVRAAIDNLDPSYNIIVVHDGVRPFVRPDLIERVVMAAAEGGCAIAAVPVRDTIKVVSDEKVERTMPRERLWSAQTPQAFRAEILREAHIMAKEDAVYDTDDSALVERLGYQVSVVKGSYDNIKITTPEDLVIAEGISTVRKSVRNAGDENRFWL